MVRATSRLRLPALVVVGVLALAACSSGGGSAASGAPSSVTTSPTPGASASASSSSDAASGCAALAHLQGTVNDHGTQPASGSSVTLTAGDFYFQATCLTSSAGGNVSVTVTNSGTALHNFSVTSLGIDQDVQPGEKITVDVRLPESGTLPFQCKYHSGAGMVGAFIIS